jgi:hypothetical protein
MVLPERGPMRDRHECDAQRRRVIVHGLLNLEGDSTGALVQDGILTRQPSSRTPGFCCLSCRCRVGQLTFGLW